MTYFAVFKRHSNAPKPQAVKAVLTEDGEIDFAATDKLVAARQSKGVLGTNWTLVSARTPEKAVELAIQTGEGQTARPPHLGEKFRAARKPWRVRAQHFG